MASAEALGGEQRRLLRQGGVKAGGGTKHQVYIP